MYSNNIILLTHLKGRVLSTHPGSYLLNNDLFNRCQKGREGPSAANFLSF